MKNDDPYAPVRVPAFRITIGNRPYYIYATAVVMLLWSGIYVYLQSQGTVGTEVTDDAVNTPVRLARSMHGFSPAEIAVSFILSMAVVNGALWAALRLIKR
ncbi:MAG: hypothetical protein SFV81_27630 [Pirellulaceae bacterium]|nr:hypothetical protein [Pirellulaceae bacterium]